jgi:hypothetical protein
LPPRGEPLKPGRWYTQPLFIEPRKDGKASYQARQGDLYKGVPSLWIQRRPIHASRNRQARGSRVEVYLHSEDGPEPQQPWTWATGEDVVVRAIKGYGVLLSQDCELEKKDPKIAFGYVRLVDGSQGETAMGLIKNRSKFRSFYLAGQDADPSFPEAYVDFGRITTLDLEAIRPLDRYASMTDDVRLAMREDFIDFLTRERAEDE